MKNASENIVTLTREEYEKLVSENQYLKQELDKIKKMIFAARSERFIPAGSDQMSLELNIEQQEAPEQQEQEITYKRNKAKTDSGKGHARQPLPAHLPREEQIIEPEEDTTGCKKIGENITEYLDYKPGKLFVKKIIRPKYAKPNDEGVITADLPTQPIPRSNAGAGLLAYLIISKFVDHLPFYRQKQMFRRESIDMAESTINDWFRTTCKLLSPLYERLREKLLETDYLMADETPIQVLTSQKKDASHKGYYWVYYATRAHMVCFDYQKGRGREGPTAFLQNFKGALQSDGYKAYDIFGEKPGFKLLACMAHARRKFFEAKDNDKKRSEEALTMIQELYETERKARENNLSHDERKVLRQEESLPVLKELESWLKANLTQVLPKSAIGKAIAYTLGLWERLKRYTEDGKYEIDNNLVENSIRPVALGRKNYLFAGSHEGAERAAMMYSFLGTCKQNNVEPFAWLKDVITRLPDYNHKNIDELLPGNWKPIID